MVFGEVHSSLVSSPLDYSTDPKKKKNEARVAKGQDQLGHNEIKMGQTMLNYTLQLNIYLTTDFKRTRKKMLNQAENTHKIQ